MENFPCKRGQLGSEADIFFLLVSACFAFNLIKYTVQSSLRALKRVFYFVYSLSEAASKYSGWIWNSGREACVFQCQQPWSVSLGHSVGYRQKVPARTGLTFHLSESSDFYLFLRPAVMLLTERPCLVGISAGGGRSAAGQEKALLGSLMGSSVLWERRAQASSLCHGSLQSIQFLDVFSLTETSSYLVSLSWAVAGISRNSTKALLPGRKGG